jgi:hypothetical protein
MSSLMPDIIRVMIRLIRLQSTSGGRMRKLLNFA